MYPNTIIFIDREDNIDIEHKYDTWKYDLCQDSRSHFFISIPDTWYVSDAYTNSGENTNPNASLATFKESNSSATEIEVIEEKLQREISPEHWLNFLIEKLERRILFSRVYEQQIGNILDCLVEDEEGKWVYRMFALKNEDRILLVEARGKRDDYIERNLSEVFFMAVANFTIINPSDWALSEPAKTYSRQIPGDFCLIYPKSWTLREIQGCNQSDIRHLELHNLVDDNAIGKVDFSVYKKDLEVDCYGILDLDLEGMKAHGVQIPKLDLKEIDIDAFKNSWGTKFYIEKGKDITTDVEVEITIGSNSDAWYVIKLLTPTRDNLPDIWSINQTAYEIVLKWLRTPHRIQKETQKKTTRENGQS